MGASRRDGEEEREKGRGEGERERANPREVPARGARRGRVGEKRLRKETVFGDYRRAPRETIEQRNSARNLSNSIHSRSTSTLLILYPLSTRDSTTEMSGKYEEDIDYSDLEER